MSRKAASLKNLPFYQNVSQEILEAAAARAHRPATVEIDGFTVKAATITVAMADGHSFDVTSVHGSQSGFWVTPVLDESEMRFLPWPSVVSIRVLNPKATVRR
jgi:hypothetical protein